MGWCWQTRWIWNQWQVFIRSPSLSGQDGNQQVCKCVLVSPGIRVSWFPDAHRTSDTFPLLFMNWESDRFLIGRRTGGKATDNSEDGRPLVIDQRWRPCCSLDLPQPVGWPCGFKATLGKFYIANLRDYQPPCLCSNWLKTLKGNSIWRETGFWLPWSPCPSTEGLSLCAMLCSCFLAPHKNLFSLAGPGICVSSPQPLPVACEIFFCF